MTKIEAINEELSRLNNLLEEASDRQWVNTKSFIKDRIISLQDYLKTPAAPLEIIDTELDRLHITYRATLKQLENNYIWVGEDRIDMTNAMKKLHKILDESNK